MATFREICEMLSLDTLREMVNDLSGERGLVERDVLSFLERLVAEREQHEDYIEGLKEEQKKRIEEVTDAIENMRDSIQNSKHINIDGDFFGVTMDKDKLMEQLELIERLAKEKLF